MNNIPEKRGKYFEVLTQCFIDLCIIRCVHYKDTKRNYRRPHEVTIEYYGGYTGDVFYYNTHEEAEALYKKIFKALKGIN